MEGAQSGELKFGFCLGGNLYGSNPDSRFAKSALRNLEMLVQLNTTLNTGHAHGLARETIILPVLARDEESQSTTQESMFNYVRLSDGGQPRFEGAKSEVDVIAQIAELVLGEEPLNWRELRSHELIRQWIGKIVPGWKPISSIGQSREEFQINGRTLHQPQFPTDDGKARLHIHEIPELKGGGDQLRLMTVRSEGQFNTVVYEEEDIYRGVDRRDVVLIHPEDVQRLGLQHDQPVTVANETGKVSPVRVRAFEDIKPGNALMYYPEANALVSRRIDPSSRTPAFKGELVTILEIED